MDLHSPETSSSFRSVISECLLSNKQLPSDPANFSHLSVGVKWLGVYVLVNSHTTWVQLLAH